MKTDSKKRIIFLTLALTILLGTGTSLWISLKNLETSKKEYNYVNEIKEKEGNPRIEIIEEPTEEVEHTIPEEPMDIAEEVTVEVEQENILEEVIIPEEAKEENPVVETSPIVYDNMTLEELSAKLDRSLNSTLTGTGNLFATYAIQLGIDPYMAVAIVLEETGCKWNCSALVKNCNNVGGQKGGPSCNGGSYKAYPTLEAGIQGFLDNLYNNYYALGLTTPEQINTKYAASTAWSSKINNYIAQIREA